MNVRMKAPEKDRAACPARQAAPKNMLLNESYPNALPLSSEILREQIGLLLWLLCSPMSEKQSVAGWRLLEVLLSEAYEVSE